MQKMIPAPIHHAYYEDQIVKDYRGNPFIEALPPVMHKDDVAKYLKRKPEFDKSERSLDSALRLHLIPRVRQLILPFPKYFSFETSISSMIRRGYLGRDRLESGQKVYEAKKWDWSAQAPLDSTAGTASETLLLGLSGMGKTTMADAVLATYGRRTICHTSYKGRPFEYLQIPYLKLQCPHNGSLSALCRAFFSALDAHLGSDRYSTQYRNPRIDVEALEAAMCQLAASYNIGLLVIDELQNLSVQNSGGVMKMMNFFMNLRNNISVPLLLIGTHKAMELFTTEMRHARRVNENGSHIVEPASDWKSRQFKELVSLIWAYQWVREPVELTNDIMKLLYELTQGITDFLIVLFCVSQVEAILKKKESVDEKVIKHTYKNRMQLIHSAVDALRMGDLDLYEDLRPKNMSIDAFLGAQKVVSSPPESSTKAEMPAKGDQEAHPQGQSSASNLHGAVETGNARDEIRSTRGRDPLKRGYDHLVSQGLVSLPITE